MTDWKIQNLTDEQQSMFESVRVFATLRQQRVEVDVDTVADGRVDVVGDFGYSWTHGGFAPVTRRRVPIAALAEKELVTE